MLISTVWVTGILRTLERLETIDSEPLMALDPGQSRALKDRWVSWNRFSSFLRQVSHRLKPDGTGKGWGF